MASRERTGLHILQGDWVSPQGRAGRMSTWVQRLLHLPQELEGSATSRQDVCCRKFVSSVEVSFLYISLYVQTGSFLFQTILLQSGCSMGPDFHDKQKKAKKLREGWPRFTLGGG